MYLFILEDNTIQKSNTITDSDKHAVAEGLLDIIAIGDYDPAQWFNNKWHEIQWVNEDKSEGMHK